ncbi:MAG: hypothetical protein IT437_03995 [Phycisphaerales bacterium]|nr:hypothetical protein [Phycisphaerales bacterium]
MIRALRRALVALTLAMQAGVLAQAPASQAPAAHPTLVRVDETDPVDCTGVPIGEAAVRRVEIVSTTDRDVSLRVLGTSCPCTTAVLSKPVLKPGASATLMLRVQVADVGGRQMYTASIQATSRDDSGVVSEQRLTVPIAYLPAREVVTGPKMSAGYHVGPGPVIVKVFARRIDRGVTEVGGLSSKNPLIKIARVRRDGEDPRTAVVELAVNVRPGSIVQDYVKLAGPDGAPIGGEIWVSARCDFPVRAEPPGKVLMLGGDSGVWATDFHLVPTEGGGVLPGGVKVVSDSPAFEVVGLAPDKEGATLRVRRHDDAMPESHGHATLRIMSSEGERLGEVPIVWFRGAITSPAPAQPKDRP